MAIFVIMSFEGVKKSEREREKLMQIIWTNKLNLQGFSLEVKKVKKGQIKF